MSGAALGLIQHATSKGTAGQGKAKGQDPDTNPSFSTPEKSHSPSSLHILLMPCSLKRQDQGNTSNQSTSSILLLRSAEKGDLSPTIAFIFYCYGTHLYLHKQQLEVAKSTLKKAVQKAVSYTHLTLPTNVNV